LATFSAVSAVVEQGRTQMSGQKKFSPISLEKSSPSIWRAILNNPPLNLLAPQTISALQSAVGEMETDADLKVGQTIRQIGSGGSNEYISDHTATT
jgi:hypothetical protein